MAELKELLTQILPDEKVLLNFTKIENALIVMEKLMSGGHNSITASQILHKTSELLLQFWPQQSEKVKVFIELFDSFEKQVQGTVSLDQNLLETSVDLAYRLLDQMPKDTTQIQTQFKVSSEVLKGTISSVFLLMKQQQSKGEGRLDAHHIIQSVSTLLRGLNPKYETGIRKLENIVSIMNELVMEIQNNSSELSPSIIVARAQKMIQIIEPTRGSTFISQISMLLSELSVSIEKIKSLPELKQLPNKEILTFLLGLIEVSNPNKTRKIQEMLPICQELLAKTPLRL